MSTGSLAPAGLTPRWSRRSASGPRPCQFRREASAIDPDEVRWARFGRGTRPDVSAWTDAQHGFEFGDLAVAGFDDPASVCAPKSPHGWSAQVGYLAATHRFNSRVRTTPLPRWRRTWQRLASCPAQSARTGPLGIRTGHPSGKVTRRRFAERRGFPPGNSSARLGCVAHAAEPGSAPVRAVPGWSRWPARRLHTSSAGRTESRCPACGKASWS